MPVSDVVVDVVERARTRALAQVTLREAALAGTIAMLGPLLVALFGTGWFPAGLIVLFVFAGLAAGAYRWSRQRPSSYGVAQHIDAAWRSDDRIATAYYFAEHPSEAGPLARFQRAQAAPLATSGDIAAALPFEMPKTGYAFGGALLLLVVLLGIRYGTQSSLSLQPPLVPIEAPALYADAGDELQRDEPTKVESPKQEPAQSIRKENKLEKPQEDPEPEPIPEAIDGQSAMGDAVGDASEALPEVEGLSIDDDFGDELAGGSNDGGEEQEGADGTEPSQEGSDGDPNPENGSPEQGSESEDSNDLLSRLEDAFRNMLSGMNMEPPAGSESGESSDEQSGEPSPAEGAQPGQQSEGEAPDSGESGTEGEGASGAAPEAPQELTQGDSGSDSSAAAPEGATASSAGSNDGSKELTEAEQMQAMGELDELYQQRAEDMSGEVLIETEAAPQQLQTPYSPTAAGHRDPGGQVSRDEIPFAYRKFVQKYFEALREKSGK